MKRWVSTILIIGFLTVGTLSAQTLTETEVTGTYRITKCMQPAPKNGEKPISYNAATERAKVDKAIGDLRRIKPNYTAKDSINVVNDISLLYVSFAPLRYTYKTGGVMELSTGASGGKSKPVVAKWVFNAATQQITLTYDYNKKKTEMLRVENRDGITYLVQKSDDGTFIEFVKE